MFIDPDNQFVLNPLLKGSLRKRKPQFGFGAFSEVVFYRTYSRTKDNGGQESWADVVIRNVEGIMTIRKDWYRKNRLPWNEDYWQDVAVRMANAMYSFRFTPPGRSLWAQGSRLVYERGSAALNNCFGPKTMMLTYAGAAQISDLSGQTTLVLTQDGWQSALVRHFGTQATRQLTFAPVFVDDDQSVTTIPDQITKTIEATDNHRWPLIDGSLTTNLQVGDLVQSNTNPDPLVPGADGWDQYQRGVVHGIFFMGSSFDGLQARLQLQDAYLPYVDWFTTFGSVVVRDGNITLETDFAIDKLPDPAIMADDLSAWYIRGFVDGCLVGAETRDGSDQIVVADRDAASWLIDHAPLAGYLAIATTESGHQTRIRLVREHQVAWQLIARSESTVVQDVYCAVVPGTERFTLTGGIYTGNCAYVDVKHLSKDAEFLMDALMLGVGVGYSTHRASLHLSLPSDQTVTYVIPDSREGWVESTRRLIESYEKGSQTVLFDYSQIRPSGSPIKGFGGTASGPDPLIKLHERLREYLDRRAKGETTDVRVIADTMNAIAACVVAGNVRRSALLSLGSPDDAEFSNLKNYGIYPERAEIGWASNNSIALESTEDFERLPEIADRIRTNGEPGVINFLNIRKYGRYGEEMPDTAIGTNPCVTGDTPILTRDGYVRIDALVGQSVEVWNGLTWSLVTPMVTGQNQPLVRVELDDGTTLTCTPYHGFMVRASEGQQTPTRKEARDLGRGDLIWDYAMPVVEGDTAGDLDPREAYTQGFFAGCGGFNQDQAWIELSGETTKLVHHIDLERWVNDTRHGRTLVYLPQHTGYGEQNAVPSPRDGLVGRLAWLAGLIDAAGTIDDTGTIKVVCDDLVFLRSTRLMLTTLGVKAAIVDDGQTLTISRSGTAQLSELGIGPFLKYQQLPKAIACDDDHWVVRVRRVVQLDEIADQVYCFNEPINHTGTFNGIVTAQCAEATLEDRELCNLVEIFPTRNKTDAEFYETVELATIFASTVSLLPTHWEETNAVLSRNRRIGVSLSGVADWIENSSASSVTTRMRKAYRIVEATNRRLAREAGVPESIRKTVLKPSGTVSQLAGVSSGLHFPAYSQYIRRVRVAANAPITPLLIEANIPYEPDTYSDNTLVFEFPVSQGKTRSQKDVSMWAKGAVVQMVQRHWTDQMPSNTITFDPKTEAGQIEDFLAFSMPFLKSLSMLPLDDSVYAQPPYEYIDMAEIERRREQIRPIDWKKFEGSDGEQELYCDTDNCVVL